MDAFSDTPKLRPISKKPEPKTSNSDGADANSSTNDSAAYDPSFYERWAGKQTNYNSGYISNTFNNPHRFRHPPPLHYPNGIYNYNRPDYLKEYRSRPPPVYDNFQWKRKDPYQVNNYQKPALENSNHHSEQSEKRQGSESKEENWSKTKDYSKKYSSSQRKERNYDISSEESEKRQGSESKEENWLKTRDYSQKYRSSERKEGNYDKTSEQSEKRQASESKEENWSKTRDYSQKYSSSQRKERNYDKYSEENEKRQGSESKEEYWSKTRDYNQKYSSSQKKERYYDKNSSSRYEKHFSRSDRYRSDEELTSHRKHHSDKYSRDLAKDRNKYSSSHKEKREDYSRIQRSPEDKYNKRVEKSKSIESNTSWSEKLYSKQEENLQILHPAETVDIEENQNKDNEETDNNENKKNEKNVENIDLIELTADTESIKSSTLNECAVEIDHSLTSKEEIKNKLPKTKRKSSISTTIKKSPKANKISKETKTKNRKIKSKDSKLSVIQNTEKEFLNIDKECGQTLFEFAKLIEKTSLIETHLKNKHSNEIEVEKVTSIENENKEVNENNLEKECGQSIFEIASTSLIEQVETVEKVTAIENQEISSSEINKEVIENFEQFCKNSEPPSEETLIITAETDTNIINQILKQVSEEFQTISDKTAEVDLEEEIENVPETSITEGNLDSGTVEKSFIKLVPLEKLLDPSLSETTSRRFNSESNDSNKNSEDEHTMNHILGLPVEKIKKIINEKSRYDEFFKTQSKKRLLLKSAAEQLRPNLSEIFQPEEINVENLNPAEINTNEDIENSIESTMLCNSILIVDSSSSGHSSDSDVDSDACADRKHALHKSVDEGHVISSFEKLILPNIRQGLQSSYKDKFSSSINNKLHFISCICTSEYNTDKFTKYEIAKIQRNIHFKDNSLAIEFLKRQIENIFSNLDKPIWKTKKSKPPNEQEMCTIEIECGEAETENKSVDDAEKVNAEDNNEEQMQSTLTENQNKNETSNVLEKPVEKNTKTIENNELRDNEASSLNVPIEKAEESADEQQEENLQENYAEISNNNNNVDSLLTNIQEINMKLLDLRNRGILIDEMITKFQKDKIELNLMAAELEKQKYMLLNAHLTSKMNAMSEQNVINNLNETAKKRKKKLCSKNANSIKRARFQTKKATIYKKQKKEPTKTIDEIENKQKKDELPTANLEVEKKDVCENKTEKSVICDTSLKQVNEQLNATDYVDINTGVLEQFKGIVISAIYICDYTLLAGSENGDFMEYDLRDQTLKNKYRKHSFTITQICVLPKDQLIYTICLDGFFKITNLQNLQIDIQSVRIGEPLQTLDFAWDTAFIGSRWGNIYTYDLTTSKINVTPLCTTNISITIIKTLTNYYGRKIIIVGGRGPEIFFRDARTGIILHTINLPHYIYIFNIFVDKNSIYCSTQKKDVYKFDISSGTHLSTMHCGNGAACMSNYKNRYLLVGSHDGFIYVTDKETNTIIGNIATTGRMILAMDVLGDKIITSTKNKGLQIMDIPKHIVVRAMEAKI